MYNYIHTSSYLGHGLELLLSPGGRHVSADEHRNRLILGGLELFAVQGSEALRKPANACDQKHVPTQQCGVMRWVQALEHHESFVSWELVGDFLEQGTAPNP